MAYRDVLFVPLASVFVLEGLAPAVVDALPAALPAVARARRSARRRWPGSALRARRTPVRRLAALAARSVHWEPNTLSDAELVSASHRHGFSGLPIALTLTSTRCAVATAHAVYDGSGSLDLIHDLLDAAAGAALTREPPAAQLPVVQALRQVRLQDVRAFVEPRLRRPPGIPAAEARHDLVRSPVPTSAAFSLSSADLAAVRRYREPDRVGRPTLHSRLASLTVAALREIATTDLDIPVWVTSDIRHLVDGPVDGNFITRERVGSLHGEQWAPGALAARLVRLKGPGQALSLVWSTTGWLLRSALGKRPAAGEEIVLTFATTQRALPFDVGTVTATSVGGSPTFAFVWQTRGAVHLSVYNSSGAFDLTRFEVVFRRIVEERAAG